jgi:hypothetical protein
MGRPRKIIEGQEEAVSVVGTDARIAYIKNGVTRLRYPADEADLLAAGWERK